MEHQRERECDLVEGSVKWSLKCRDEAHRLSMTSIHWQVFLSGGKWYPSEQLSRVSTTFLRDFRPFEGEHANLLLWWTLWAL